jgi:hypothetical protein
MNIWHAPDHRRGLEMTTKDKSGRKRKPPTQLLISEESEAAYRARLDAEEGQRCIDGFATLIARWAATSMPSELLQALGIPEGQKVLEELWPDIVNAYFRPSRTPWLDPAQAARERTGAHNALMSKSTDNGSVREEVS